MDAIHYKVKENHLYITKAAYVVLGIGLDERKNILGVWIGENKSAKFWISVMNSLKNRGINDIYVFCVDGLTGFREAINAAFPKSQIQRCIIYQTRSSTRYVSYKDIKAVMADLKKVYQAINEDEAMNALMEFKEKWAKTYPSCASCSVIGHWFKLRFSSSNRIPESRLRYLRTVRIAHPSPG